MMELSEKAFKILDTLDRHEIINQRQLAEHSGVSLAQVNYLLKQFIQKGLVKMNNFKKSPHKSRYLYLLTPRGLEAKSQAAARFLMSKLSEYNHLRSLLYRKLVFLQKAFLVRIVLVGPHPLRDFVVSVIKENRLKLTLVNHYSQWTDLKGIDLQTFDIALLFDSNSESVTKISNQLNIPKEKLALLW